MRRMRVIEFPPHAGFPADYLVARLCGRRGLMVRDWEAFLMTERPVLPARYRAHGGRPEEAISRTLGDELRWVARQMDDGLREAFRPVFEYFELDTVFACIRYKARRDFDEEVRSALEASLLSGKMKDALMDAASQKAAMRVAEEAFSSRSDSYRGVAKTEKTAEAEQRLTDIFLAESAAHAVLPVIRGFFRIVIDMRNLVSAYKRLRWGIEAAPPVIEGGNALTRRIRAIATEAALLSETRKFTGLPAERPSEVEPLFLRRLLMYSKNAIREHRTVGTVLNYLLRWHFEARNLSLIFAGTSLEREFLQGEMVS